MTIPIVNSISVTKIVHQLARVEAPLSNKEFCDLVEKFNSRELFRIMVQSGCVRLEQDPLTKQYSRVAVQGDRFCRLFMKTYATEIQKKRELIQKQDLLWDAFLRKVQLQKREEIKKKEAEKNDRKKSDSPKEREKRDAVRRDIYNTEVAVYEGKLKFEKALDEIYLVANAPDYFIPLQRSETQFQRRSQAQIESFENANKPKEPHYEKPLETRNLNNERPIPLSEQPLETFESLFVQDKHTSAQRLENALEILERQFGLLAYTPYYTNMTIEIRGESILVSDILYNQTHPYYRLARLQQELQNRTEDDLQAKSTEEMRLRKLVGEKNVAVLQARHEAEERLKQELQNRTEADLQAKSTEEMRLRKLEEEKNVADLQARHEAAERLLQLIETKNAVLNEFKLNKQYVKTHQAIRKHNDEVAVELFRRLYLSLPRSHSGSMREMIKQPIKSFSEIEKYAYHNQSKTRNILRKYKSEFGQILHSPLFMQFEIDADKKPNIKPCMTFQRRRDAQAYGRWYTQCCPKYRSDDAFIRLFSDSYTQRLRSSKIDKIGKWIRKGEIFSYKQLTLFAKLNPTSEAAKILKTTLAAQLNLLQCHELEIEELTIKSQFYVDPESDLPNDISTIGEETIYGLQGNKCETYTPSKNREPDGIDPLNLYSVNAEQRVRLFTVENQIDQFYQENIVNRNS